MLIITLEGTKKELETAKKAIEKTCLLGENCREGITCEECEKSLVKIKYIEKQ